MCPPTGSCFTVLLVTTIAYVTVSDHSIDIWWEKVSSVKHQAVPTRVKRDLMVKPAPCD